MLKYFTKFDTQAEYDEAKYELDYPNVSIVASSVTYTETMPIQPQYRTVTTATTCEGYDLYTLEEYQVSYDGGTTWTTTASSATTLIESDSQSCGYVPPTPSDAFNAYDENGQLLTSTGCDRIEEVFAGGLTQDIVTDDFEVNTENIWSVEIPDCVLSIGNGAFQSCSSLQSVTIPDSVTSIGENAFNSCGSLTGLTIGIIVEVIGNYAFKDCYSLQSVTIPAFITSIGDEAFMNCYSLQSVTILINPYGVSLGTDAFGDSTSNFPIYVPSESLEDWKSAHPEYVDRFEAIVV